MSKQTGKKIEAKLTICSFFFHLESFFFVFVVPRVQNGTIRCRLPLCTCMFGFRAMVRQRPTIKVRSHSPEHHLPNPPPTSRSPPLPDPSHSPCRREQHDSGTPRPGPKLHARFFCSVCFVFCFVLYFFVK